MATATQTRTRSRDSKQEKEAETSNDPGTGQVRQQTIDQFLSTGTQEEGQEKPRQFGNISGFSPYYTPKEHREEDLMDEELEEVYSNAQPSKSAQSQASYTGYDSEYLIDETVDPAVEEKLLKEIQEEEEMEAERKKFIRESKE